MRGFFRSTGGALTLATLLLAVLATPLQPAAEVIAAADGLPCNLLAADDGGFFARC